MSIRKTKKRLKQRLKEAIAEQNSILYECAWDKRHNYAELGYEITSLLQELQQLKRKKI